MGNEIGEEDDGYYFIVGNGVGKYADGRDLKPNNAFAVKNDGTTYTGSSNTQGADYAEYYEWLDSNPNDEDRRGYFVTLEGNKIRKANSYDDYILGIISSTPAVVGNSYNDSWYKKYKTDIFGKVIYQEVTIPAEYDEEGNEIEPEHNEMHPVLNPEYNPKQGYISRANRPEWSVVGTHGQLVTIDDGTCIINGYAKVTNEGIAAYSNEKTDFRVIERLDETHIRIVLK